MMLSIMRQGRPTIQMDHLQALAKAAGSDDIDLLSYCFTHGRPVFAGVDGHPSIVKQRAEGDDKLTYEALVDDAVTAREYKRMQDHGVSSLKEVGDRRYRARLVVTVPYALRADFLVRAKDDFDVRRKVRELVNNDDFRRELTCRFFEIFTEIMHDEEIYVRFGGATQVEDVARPDAPEYEFLIHPDAD